MQEQMRNPRFHWWIRPKNKINIAEPRLRKLEATMKTPALFLILAILPAFAADPVIYKYWSAAELKGYEKKLGAKVTPTNKVVLEEIVNAGNYFSVMAQKQGNTPAELHDAWADLYVIVSGNGILEVGGTLLDSKAISPGEWRGPSIKGGTKQKLAAGDIVHIPLKTPHNVMVDPGQQITYLVFKVKK
jgi:mannose-6-phosphate isomerase-like protein (cupin superfamily)